MAQGILEDIKFKSVALGETVTTDWMVDNVGEVVDVDIHVRFEDYVLAETTDLEDGGTVVYIRPPSSVTGVVADDRHLWTSDPTGFEDWVEGDVVHTNGAQIGGNSVKNTILEKVDDQTLVMVDPYGGTEKIPVAGLAFIETPIQSIEFLHGLIENEESLNYNSKVDGSEQRARIDGLSSTNSTYQPMTLLGKKSWQYGSMSVKGNFQGDGTPATTGAQAFIIKHTFVVNPLFLANQINDEKNGVAPEYLRGKNSLKYVLRVEASKDLSNPNKKKIIIEDERLGNVGNTGENFNTGRTNYSSTTPLYKNGAVTNTALELTSSETTIEFYIDNTTDSPFSSGNTKFVLSHWLAPTPEDEYRQPEFVLEPNLAKDRDMKTNFIFDRIECTLDDLSTTPDNLGTDIQVIKDCIFTLVNPTRVKCTATISLAPAAATRIAAMSGMDYKLAVSTKNHSLTRAKSDKVNLDIDFDEYYINTTDPTMIDMDLAFLEHPYTDTVTDSKTLITAGIEDDILGFAKFRIDTNTREDDTILLSSATMEIIARKDADEFTLDSYSTTLDNLDIVNNVPFVDVTKNRGFITPCDTLRQDTRIYSDTPLDAAGVFNYQFNFPFILRWEKWEPLPDASTDFFDASEQNKGLNNNWVKYSTLGWSVYLKATINATKNGVPQKYTEEAIINTRDYLAGAKWDSEDIVIRDNATGDSLLSGSQYILQTELDSRIEALKTYVGADGDPVVGDLAWQIKINEYEKGNFKAQYTLSSEYDAHPDTILLSSDSSNRVLISNVSGSIFQGLCLTDGSKLPSGSGNQFKISDRVWDKRAETPIPFGQAKIQENGDYKLNEDGTYKIYE